MCCLPCLFLLYSACFTVPLGAASAPVTMSVHGDRAGLGRCSRHAQTHVRRVGLLCSTGSRTTPWSVEVKGQQVCRCRLPDFQLSVVPQTYRVKVILGCLVTRVAQALQK
jgi:hypothetical protein